MRATTVIFGLFASAVLAGCVQTDAQSVPLALDKDQSKLLGKLLDGKIAAAPVNCISTFDADNIIRVSDDLLLFRQSGKLVYQNRLRAPCPGLADDDDILVTEQFGSQKCSGDLIRLVDRISGFQGPSCILGDFIPYRKIATAP
jgi:hypothetical protein